MSVRKVRLRLAPRARQDIRSIRLYSLEQWGALQASAYDASLDRGLDTLRANPEIGVSRGNVLPGLRAHPIGRHVFYYRIVADTIEVLRILHERVDPVRHLRP